MISLVSPPKNLGPAVCVVCGKSKGGSVLKHPPIRDIFEMKVPGQWDLCKEHKKLFQEGYIALIEAMEPETLLIDDGQLSPSREAVRTGVITHVRYELAEQLFKTAIDRSLPLVFCKPNVSKRFEEMLKFAMRKKSS